MLIIPLYLDGDQAVNRNSAAERERWQKGQGFATSLDTHSTTIRDCAQLSIWPFRVLR